MSTITITRDQQGSGKIVGVEVDGKIFEGESISVRRALADENARLRSQLQDFVAETERLLVIETELRDRNAELAAIIEKPPTRQPQCQNCGAAAGSFHEFGCAEAIPRMSTIPCLCGSKYAIMAISGTRGYCLCFGCVSKAVRLGIERMTFAADKKGSYGEPPAPNAPPSDGKTIGTSWDNPPRDIRKDVAALAKLITKQTGLVVGKQPTFAECREEAIANNPVCQDHYSGLNGICAKCGKP